MQTLTSSPTTVNPLSMVYDRKERIYNWVNPTTGEMHSFTSEQKKSGQALIFAIGMLEPDLYQAAQRIITANPQMERVVWAAVQIVAANGVQGVEIHEQVLAMVASTDGEGRYAIQYDPRGNHLTCQCENYTRGEAPQTKSGVAMCKHITAYRLHLVTRHDETTGECQI